MCIRRVGAARSCAGRIETFVKSQLDWDQWDEKGNRRRQWKETGLYMYNYKLNRYTKSCRGKLQSVDGHSPMTPSCRSMAN